MDSLKNRLLSHYGLSKEDYAAYTAEPSFSLIPGIAGESSVNEGIRLIKASIQAKQKILIHGDYDTDGIMAASIMKRSLATLGIEARHFIPSRYKDGYGLTLENAKRIAKSGYGLVILVDNGVSCFDSVSYLRGENVNVLIIDHHNLPASLPPSNAIIHDQLLKYGKYPVSAGFLCYLFSCALLNKNDPYLFTLGSISLLSDVMPILGHNRAAIGLALRAIKKYEFPEIMMLTDRTYIDEKVLCSEIIPKINAIGRIKTGYEPSRLVDYFAAFEAKNKFGIAEWAKEVNEERKAITKAASEAVKVDAEAAGIVIKADLLEGLNGLLANRLLSQYNKPVVVFSNAESDNTMLVGSFRSKKGFEFPEFEPFVSHLLQKSGGHAYAAGMSIKKEDFEAFRLLFLDFAKEHPLNEPSPELIPLHLSEVHMGTYREIRKFGPFGEKHKEPFFLLEEVPTGMLRYTRNGKYMRTPIDEKTALVSFNFGENDIKGSEVRLKGCFQISEFKGAKTLDLLVERYGDEK